MTIIQNVVCLPITIDPSSHSILFKKDILRDKKIKSLLMFASDDEQTAVNPYNDEALSQFVDLMNLSMYLNLEDANKNLFIKDFSFENSLMSPSLFLNFEIEINRILNLDNCNIVVSTPTIPNPIDFLLYVFYQTENFHTYNDEVNGLVTIEFPITDIFEDIKLSTLVNETLKGRKIKKIIFRGSTSTIYLDIVAKNKRIENLPVVLLGVKNTKEFVFDDIEIDFENSFLKMRSSLNDGNGQLIFIY